MRRGLVTGVCLNIKQSRADLQMAGRLDSSPGLQSAGKSLSLLLQISQGSAALRVEVLLGGCVKPRPRGGARRRC